MPKKAQGVQKGATKLLKVCPHCSFERCWVKASECEECGYDFINKRKPKQKPKIIIEEDEPKIIVVKPEEPKSLKKCCPECAHMCWHKAPSCENCDYNFETGKTKAQQIRKKQKQGDFIMMPEDVPSGRPRPLELYKPGTHFYQHGWFRNGKDVEPSKATWGILLDINFCAAKVKYIRNGTIYSDYWSPGTLVLPIKDNKLFLLE